jgi:FkbM family methyltransferase
MLRDRLSDGVKLRIRRALAKLGIEIGAYAGSFAEHRTLLIRGSHVETVWDVGAHVGQYAVQLQSHGYVGHIISIEPSNVAFRELSVRAARSESWTALSVAVADIVGEGMLNVAANGQSSSLLPMAERHRSASPGSRYVGSQPVKTTTLDALQDRMTPPRPYFVKLDLQGGELPALRGAASVLRSAVACEIELSFTELYEGGASWQEVIAQLATEGFVICDVERVFFDPASGDLLQVNALFRRPPSSSIP